MVESLPAMNFIPLIGKFEITNGSIIFEGRAATTQPTAGADVCNIGNLLSDQFFGAGTIQGTIEFVDAKIRRVG